MIKIKKFEVTVAFVEEDGDYTEEDIKIALNDNTANMAVQIKEMEPQNE